MSYHYNSNGSFEEYSTKNSDSSRRYYSSGGYSRENPDRYTTQYYQRCPYCGYEGDFPISGKCPACGETS